MAEFASWPTTILPYTILEGTIFASTRSLAAEKTLTIADPGKISRVRLNGIGGGMSGEQTQKVQVLGRGVYSIAEASRLTRLRPRRVREWFLGRISPKRLFKPVFQSDYPVFHEEHAISFLDLVELNIGGKLREAGISLHYLRKVYDYLENDFGKHPFCSRQIYVGGKKIFTRGLSAEEGNVIEAITGQSYFDDIIMPFLKKIEYDTQTDLAIRWHIADLVVIDPEIRFGRPIVEGIGIATSVLRQAYYANKEDEDFVADWFGIKTEHVLAAVEFENALAA